jgi:hypothetical protein
MRLISLSAASWKRHRGAFKIATVFALIVSCVSCVSGASVQQQEQDFAAEAACVAAHWGQPVITIALDCTSQDIAVVEDIVVDIELAIEGNPSVDGGAPPIVADAGAAFPYASNASIMHKLTLKKAAAAR